MTSSSATALTMSFEKTGGAEAMTINRIELTLAWETARHWRTREGLSLLVVWSVRANLETAPGLELVSGAPLQETATATLPAPTP